MMEARSCVVEGIYTQVHHSVIECIVCENPFVNFALVEVGVEIAFSYKMTGVQIPFACHPQIQYDKHRNAYSCQRGPRQTFLLVFPESLPQYQSGSGQYEAEADQCIRSKQPLPVRGQSRPHDFRETLVCGTGKRAGNAREKQKKQTESSCYSCGDKNVFPDVLEGIFLFENLVQHSHAEKR